MMKTVAFTLATLALAMPVYAQSAEPAGRIEFASGTSSITIKGRVTGDGAIAYVVSAQAGQTLAVSMTTSNSSNHFNVTAPGANEAMFMGHLSGNRFTTALSASGDYTIRVYLMRNAARRDENADYSLTVSLR